MNSSVDIIRWIFSNHYHHHKNTLTEIGAQLIMRSWGNSQWGWHQINFSLMVVFFRKHLRTLYVLIKCSDHFKTVGLIVTNPPYIVLNLKPDN